MRALLLFLLLTLPACVLIIPSECRYLKTALNHATMADVQQRLGKPVARHEMSQGTMWLYEVREEQPFHRGTPTGFWCDEYRVAFDSRGILRNWTHRSFFHKGELQPEPCQAGYERLAL